MLRSMYVLPVAGGFAGLLHGCGCSKDEGKTGENCDNNQEAGTDEFVGYTCIGDELKKWTRKTSADETKPDGFKCAKTNKAWKALCEAIASPKKNLTNKNTAGKKANPDSTPAAAADAPPADEEHPGETPSAEGKKANPDSTQAAAPQSDAPPADEASRTPASRPGRCQGTKPMDYFNYASVLSCDWSSESWDPKIDSVTWACVSPTEAYIFVGQNRKDNFVELQHELEHEKCSMDMLGSWCGKFCDARRQGKLLTTDVVTDNSELLAEATSGRAGWQMVAWTSLGAFVVALALAVVLGSRIANSAAAARGLKLGSPADSKLVELAALA